MPLGIIPSRSTSFHSYAVLPLGDSFFVLSTCAVYTSGFEMKRLNTFSHIWWYIVVLQGFHNVGITEWPLNTPSLGKINHGSQYKGVQSIDSRQLQARYRPHKHGKTRTLRAINL